MRTNGVVNTGAMGLLLALASATAFGTSGSFADSLLTVGWTPAAAVTVRIAVAALLLTAPALRQLRGRWSLLRANAGAVVLYGLFAVACAQLMFFNAVSHLSVGVALLLEYSGTVLVIGWLWLRHHQRPRRLTLAGAGVALAGLTLVLNLWGRQRIDTVGVFWGLGAAVGLAFFFVMSARTESGLPPLVMTWGGLTVGALGLIVIDVSGLAPVHATFSSVRLAGATVSWVVPVLGLSVIAAAFAYVAGISAARMLGATVSSFVGLFEVLAAVLFAWLLLGQVPAPVQIAGGVLVVAGVALVRVDELRTPRARHAVTAPADPIPAVADAPAGTADSG